MNSFERFDAILNHKKPDKMPFYFPAIACTVASEIMGREIDSGGESLHFKEERSFLDGENAHDEFVHRYHENAIELNKKLGADIVRETWRSRERPSKMLDEHTLLFGSEDGPHRIKRFFPEHQSYGIIEDSGKSYDEDDLKNYLTKQMSMGYKAEDELFEEIYADQLRFKKLADPYFPTIVNALSIGVPMWEPVWLEATVLEPEMLMEYFLYQAEKAKHEIRWLSRKGFRFINGGLDIASSTGPVYSPAAFLRIMVPAIRMIAKECEKYEMVYCYRSDGNLWPITDYLFKDAGAQAYGEVDRDASMTIGKLRDRYPELLILGNISSATLNKGNVKDVREETRAGLLESCGYNYIAGPSNAVMHGTPSENLYAMIDEIEKYRP